MEWVLAKSSINRLALCALAMRDLARKHFWGTAGMHSASICVKNQDFKSRSACKGNPLSSARFRKPSYRDPLNHRGRSSCGRSTVRKIRRAVLRARDSDHHQWHMAGLGSGEAGAGSPSHARSEATSNPHLLCGLWLARFRRMTIPCDQNRIQVKTSAERSSLENDALSAGMP